MPAGSLDATIYSGVSTIDASSLQEGIICNRRIQLLSSAKPSVSSIWIHTPHLTET